MFNLEISCFSLKFKSKNIEKKYDNFLKKRTIKLKRYAYLITALILISFLSINQITFGKPIIKSFYLYFIPLITILFLFITTFFKFFNKISQLSNSITIFTSFFCIYGLIIWFPYNIYKQNIIFLIAILCLYFLSTLKFIQVLIFSFMLHLIFFLCILYSHNMLTDKFTHQYILYFGICNVVGFFAKYKIEYLLRNNYIDFIKQKFLTINNFVKYHNFSKREREVIELILFDNDNISNQDIAKKLSIKLETAKKHIKNIYKKSGAHTKIDLKLLYNNFKVKN